MDMQNRKVVVTGASSGMGRAVAASLLARGASVALMALPGPELDATVEDFARSAGPRVVACALDVADAVHVQEAFDVAERSIGPVDGVFNNAGMSTVSALADTSDEEWRRQLDVNLSGNFYVIREAARRMQPRRYGSIVNTGSELAFIGQAGYAAYSATKGGILSMTRAAAAELAQYQIRVNAVCPGAIDTPLLRAEFAQAADPARELRENEGSIVWGRIGTPQEVANAVVFLLSDQASYITGTQLLVDGGRVGCFPVGSIATASR
ncbi:SDR family NAD(P)-dependent oxidoreductase [Nocardioides sp.]|uniref:SDR family NAD(P)-dependent oxidoreductase n=1 Tax=Nocardioides sp. TaxID=35761 RepID=UPI003784DCCE